MSTYRRDIAGQHFGMVQAIEFAEIRSKNTYWHCKCDCGQAFMTKMTSLTGGRTRSCGCNKPTYISQATNRFNVPNEMRDTRLHRIWHAMKQRTTNPKNSHYKYYGGRGIQVDSIWSDDFMNFYNWAISHGYQDHLTIDRKDNDGNYNPENCRWATHYEQTLNKPGVLTATIYGQRETVAQWARETGLSYNLLRQRVKSGITGIALIS